MELNAHVRMKAQPELRGRVVWMSEIVVEGSRIIHVRCDEGGSRNVYRVNESSMEVIDKRD